MDTRLVYRTLFVAIALCMISGWQHAAAALSPACHVGAYRMNDGSVVDIERDSDTALTWRSFTGERGGLRKIGDGSWASSFGWTGRPDGKQATFGSCAEGRLRFGRLTGQRIPFDIQDVAFQSRGTRLLGRLVLPPGKGRIPIVVLVHGSEHDSAREIYSLQRLFPAEGIGAFVYDKRGTGGSGGRYTQDFNVLADDAVAAMREARRLAGPRAGRVGYQGGSEGGWVVPLAASRAPVDFAIVSFGLAVTILQEDQQSVALDMRFHGFGADETRKALDVARAAEDVIESKGTRGYQVFDDLRRKYRSEPWYRYLHGDFTFAVLPLNQVQIKEFVRKFDFEIPFRYEPMPVLEAATTPQLWILGKDDLEAPSAETSRRIRSLIAKGKNYILAVYPGAEHGMTEYELNSKGERISTRFSAGYFAMMRDFALSGRIGDRYGKAAITRPSVR